MGSLFCQWQEAGDTWACKQCGATVAMSSHDGKPFAACAIGAAKNGVAFRSMTRASRVPNFLHKNLNEGPGTELKKLLSRIGIRSEPGCKCNSRAMQMDAWGPDVCERKIDEIIGWLREEASSRRLPFSKTLATVVVRSAIRRARKHVA